MILYGEDGSVAKGDTGRALAEKIREIICEEWADAGGPLESAVIYQRLLREGAEVPAYAMSAILNAFRVGGLIEATPLCHQSEEEIRKHGDLSISDVNPYLCASSPTHPTAKY